MLERVYLNSVYESSRFARFFEVLGDDAGGSVTREVICYARSFAALSGQRVDGARIAAAAPYFIDRFLAFLRDGLAAEGG